MSQRWPTTRSGIPSSATALSTPSWVRPLTATAQPRSRNAFANPIPIPRVLPVITMTFIQEAPLLLRSGIDRLGFSGALAQIELLGGQQNADDTEQQDRRAQPIRGFGAKPDVENTSQQRADDPLQPA